MAKLIMWNLQTLDGFFEGPNHDLSWHLDVWGDELERLSIEQGKSADALLFGRLTYQLMANHWPGEKGAIADFMNAIPKFVFSRTLTKADWQNTRLFSADAASTVARLKRETEKDIFVFGSANLSESLIPHGLFDEFRICLTPHVLGGGTALFKPACERLKLSLLEAKPHSTGTVILRYAPANK
jgi:dihydrofolate reductase